MRQSFPLFSLVNIFFTWKSSLCVKEQETKLHRLDLTFTPASETPKSCHGQGSCDGISTISNPAIGHWNKDPCWFSFCYFLTSAFASVQGWLTFLCQNRTPTCTIKGRERELGMQLFPSVPLTGLCAWRQEGPTSPLGAVQRAALHGGPPVSRVLSGHPTSLCCWG